MTNDLAKSEAGPGESPPEALPALLKGCQNQIYNLCFQVLRHRQDAEDAAQEALCKVMDGIPSLLDPRHFDRWMYRVTLNTALNFRKRRATRLAHENRRARLEETARPPQDAVESLQEAMASLDDDSRSLVIQYFFERRSLEELAQANHCAVVTVWKRIDKAKTELLRMLRRIGMGAAMPDLTRILQSIEPVRAPAGLARKALGLKGGLAMAAKGGMTLAIVAPVVLLAGASILGYVRRGDPPPGTTAVQKSAAALPIRDTPRPSPSAAAVTLLPPQAPKTPQAAPRKPYPFKSASLGGPNAVAVHTWGILRSKWIDLNERDASIPEILARVGKMTGLSFRLDPTLKTGERLSMQCTPCTADECIQMLLDWCAADFEILPDGTLHVGPKGSIPGGFEREGRKMLAIAQELKGARDLMDAGWDGIRDLHDASVLRAKKISIPQGESSLQEEVGRLFEEQIFVRVDVPVKDLKDANAYHDMMNRRFLQAVEERTVGEHVERLASMSGLVVVPAESNLFYLTTEEKAAEYRAKNDQGRRATEKSVSTLDQACRESGAFSVQGFLDSIPPSLGMPVVPSEEVWDSSATITLPPGATLREGLDSLKEQGYRWALRNGKILVFK
jgi:RNA polymerase sigma-70 factor (ECF subfamily)